MGMGVIENILPCPEMHEQSKDAVHIPSFITSGVEFTIAVCSGASFPKTIVAIRLDDTFLI